MRALAATLITFGSLAGGANAAITFSQEAGTGVLEVHFSQAISFNVTTSANFNIYNVVLEDVYSVNQTENWGNLSTTTSTTTLTLNNPGSIQNSTCFDGGILSFGALDLNDLGLIFVFPSSQTVGIGDTFLLSAGTYSFEKPLPLPDVTSFSAYVVKGSDISQVSNSVPVSSIPEPSSALLVGLGALGLVASRRRIK